MKYLILFFSFLFLNRTYFAQQLQEVGQFQISIEDKWIVDGFKNLIVSSKDKIKKYNQKGELLFEQSHKKSSSFESIGLINSLKLFAFSENQQMICFYDNSLSILEKCIDLNDYNISNAKLVASSAQSGKIWVYDEVNSTLHLLSLSDKNQSQQINNLKGVLKLNDVDQLIESSSNLFVVDQTKGVYVLDVYGTLQQFISIENLNWIQIYKNHIVYIQDKQLVFRLIFDKVQTVIDIPFEIVSTSKGSNEVNFTIAENIVYIQFEDKIISWMLQVAD